MPETDCPFRAIVAGEAPASVVFEDDEPVAFLDVAPANPGHTLVVPREHAAGLAGLPQPTGGHLFRVGMRVAAALRSELAPDGVNLFLADGETAGQEVFHVHLHVLPRHEDDGVIVERSPTTTDDEGRNKGPVAERRVWTPRNSVRTSPSARTSST